MQVRRTQRWRRTLAALGATAALLAACAGQVPSTVPTASAMRSVGGTSVTGVINLDRWRVPENECLDYASNEGMLVGDTVELLGADGTSLGSAILAATDPDDPQSCRLAFTIEDFAPSDAYTFVVAGRATRAFTHAELVDAEWEVDLSPDAGVFAEPVEEASGDLRLTLTAPIPAELTATATCAIAVDARYPERGLTTISLDAPTLGSTAGHDVSVIATVKITPGWMTYASLTVFLDGEEAYNAGPHHLTGHRLDGDERGGQFPVAAVPFSGTGPSLDDAGADLAASLEWSCGEGVDADKAMGRVSIGPPFEVEADISDGRCDPAVGDWQPMWLPFAGETAWGAMTGEINRMDPALLGVQLDIPNLGEQRLLTGELAWIGEPVSVGEQGTRFETAGSLDFGLVAGVSAREVGFAAWWLCPA